MFPTRENLPWLQDRTVFYTRHGSHAYGTNIDTSDEDFKGIVVPPKEYYLGFFNRLEQVENHSAMKGPDGKMVPTGGPDAVLFEIRKFLNLAADAGNFRKHHSGEATLSRLLCARKSDVAYGNALLDLRILRRLVPTSHAA